MLLDYSTFTSFSNAVIIYHTIHYTPWLFPIIDYRIGQKVVRTSVTHSATAPYVPLLFLLHFNFINSTFTSFSNAVIIYHTIHYTPWLFPIIDYRIGQKVVRTSVTHSATAPYVPLLFLLHFNFICNLFVLYICRQLHGIYMYFVYKNWIFNILSLSVHCPVKKQEQFLLQY